MLKGTEKADEAYIGIIDTFKFSFYFALPILEKGGKNSLCNRILTSIFNLDYKGVLK